MREITCVHPPTALKLVLIQEESGKWITEGGQSADVVQTVNGEPEMFHVGCHWGPVPVMRLHDEKHPRVSEAQSQPESE